ncbi:hypothetical protein [uncultured Tenacibaculum sp.]|uniref:hypothetical protein n=1 Tax=uncultured Tenacibaculum sp. TaxID=174713 RepID=UPI00261ED747|nr:hypothetical protein [uncultured Tenacibaculum sp.]
MLKLEDFKIHEIETLGLIKGGECLRTQTSLTNTVNAVNFLGFIIETGTTTDSVDDGCALTSEQAAEIAATLG